MLFQSPMAFIRIMSRKMKNNTHKYFYVSNVIVTAIVATLFYVSFFLGDSENYLFPKLIVSGMAVLTLILWLEKGNANQAIKSANLKILLPGLGVSAVYILLMEYVGFYFSSILVFLVITIIYQHKQETIKNFWRMLLVKLSISIVFTLALYMLFTKILHVRMPEGAFF